MKMFWLSALILAAPLAGCNVPDDEKDSQELNVNSRYTVENARISGIAFSFGILSDGDTEVERFAGIRAKFERPNLGTERLKFSFEFDSYHEQWNRATLITAQPGDIYRTRQVFTPEATVVILPS